MTALSDLLDTPVAPAPGTLGAFTLGTDVLSDTVAGSIGIGYETWRLYLRVMKPAGDAVLGSFILGTDVLTPLAWVDVTADAHGIEYTRGGTPGGNPGAGSLSFHLNNQTDTYSPWQSIYWGPATLAQVGFYVGASNETLTLCTGEVTSWDERAVGVGARRWVEVSALETVTLLGENNENEVTPVGAGEALAARADRILASARWQYGYELDVDSPHQFWGLQETNLADDTWTEAQLVAQSLAVVFGPTKSGRVSYRERDRGPVAGYLTAGTDFPIVPDETIPANDDLALVGSVPVSRAGGTAVTYTGTTVGRYQRRSLPFYNLRTQNPGSDADLARYANDLLDRGDQTYRVKNFLLDSGQGNSVFEFVARMDLGTRVNVWSENRDGSGILFVDYLVCGYTVSIEPLTERSIVLRASIQTEPSISASWSRFEAPPAAPLTDGWLLDEGGGISLDEGGAGVLEE
jgi:hypothetical protein